jgi:hypothetical protein
MRRESVQEERTFPPAKMSKPNAPDTFQPPSAMIQNSGMISLTGMPQTSSSGSFQAVSLPSLSQYPAYQYISQSPVQFVGIPVPQNVSQPLMQVCPPGVVVANGMGVSLPNTSTSNHAPITFSTVNFPVGFKPKQKDVAEAVILKSTPYRTSVVVSDTVEQTQRRTISPPSSPQRPIIDIDKLINKQDDSKKRLMQHDARMSDMDRGIQEYIQSSMASMKQLVDWAMSVSAFVHLPHDARLKCLKNCWAEQLLLNQLYGNMGTLKEQDCPWFLKQLSKLAHDAGRTLKELDLDDKEVLCLELLLLFNADALDLEGDVRKHVQMSQEYVLVALEQHCTGRNFQRYGKLLVMIATLKSITRDALHQKELRESLELARVNESLIDRLLRESS